MSNAVSKRLLRAALGGDPDAWRRAWREATRHRDRGAQDRLLEAVEREARRPLLAAHLVDMVGRAEDDETPMKDRGRLARRAIELLGATDCSLYVSRSAQWKRNRVLHLGLCGAPRHMTLSPSSARWDLVRGALCGNCRRALRASASDA